MRRSGFSPRFAKRVRASAARQIIAARMCVSTVFQSFRAALSLAGEYRRATSYRHLSFGERCLKSWHTNLPGRADSRTVLVALPGLQSSFFFFLKVPPEPVRYGISFYYISAGKQLADNKKNI